MRLHFLDQDPNLFLVTTSLETRVPVAANIPTLYALEDHVPLRELGTAGATLVIGERNLDTPLGIECFKHCVYLNTIFRTYPRLSSKAPPIEGNIKPEDYEHHVNSMRNMPLFHTLNHVGILARAAQDSPALIIQPGPSFNPEFIRSVADRCVTIAISRSLPLLLEHGIVPDLIYQQDTSRHSWDTCFEMLLGKRLKSALVANPVGYIHKYYSSFAKIYKAWNFFPFEVDRMDHVLRSIAPSTTTGAFSLALHLGCNPVILHGGDFGSLVSTDYLARGFGFLPPNLVDEDGILVFRPLPRFHHMLVLPRTGDDAIATSVDYLAASQWLKREAMRLVTDKPWLKVMDHSSTNLLCESSVIEPFTHQALEGKTRRLELRDYTVPFSWTDFAREVLRRYKGIRRILSKSRRTPDISLINPYNSLYTGMEQFGSGTFDLTEEQQALALSRADEVIAVMESLLAGAKAS